jgi:hypothetical protein
MCNSQPLLLTSTLKNKGLCLVRKKPNKNNKFKCEVSYVIIPLNMLTVAGA